METFYGKSVSIESQSQNPEFKNNPEKLSPMGLFLFKQTVRSQVKCLILWHFIWVSTVCQSTHLGVYSIHLGLILCLQVITLSVDNICKQLEPRSGPTNVGPALDPNFFMLGLVIFPFFYTFCICNNQSLVYDFLGTQCIKQETLLSKQEQNVNQLMVLFCT